MIPEARIAPAGRSAGVVLALLPAVIAFGIGFAISREDGPFVAIAIFVLYRLGVVRRILCRDDRAGVIAARAGRYADALEAFRRSEAFWQRHATLDRLRAPLLGSATRQSFRVVAMYSQAYALSELGRGEEARALVARVLVDAPDMLPARELRDDLDARANAA